jgi:N-acetylneuraminic acid mutarotase
MRRFIRPGAKVITSCLPSLPIFEPLLTTRMKKNLVVLLLLHAYAFVYGNPDTWQQKTSMPAAPRSGAVAFALNGYGYAGTGQDSTGNLLNDLWKYDPGNDSWSQAAAFTGSARKNAVAFVTDTFAYVGTGFDSAGLTKDFFRYDAVNNSWQQVADLDSAGAVYPRRDAAAFSMNNKGYVVGGYDGTTYYSKDAWEFNAQLDTVWNEKALFPLPGRRWATAFSVGGYGFIGLGYNYSQEYFHDFWKFDISTNAWTQVADYTGNKRGYAASFVINGYAFAGTGYDNSFTDDFYRYDYVANTWTPIASFGGLPSSAAAGFAVNGKGYVVGGIDSAGFKNELWEYTPEDIVGIEKHDNEGTVVKVFPNPASDWLSILNTGRIGELKLFDASGKMVLVQSLSPAQKTVFIKNLHRGMYYYSLSMEAGGKNAVTGKVVFQ